MALVLDPTRILSPTIILTAYPKIERKSGKVDSLILPYDVNSFSTSYANEVEDSKSIGKGSGDSEFKGSKSSVLDVTFVLDDTTYATIASFFLPQMVVPGSVDKVIKKLLECCHSVAGNIHEPLYLTLQVFGMPLVKSAGGGFRCRLESLNIENKIVDLLGYRKKALVKCRFVECLSQEQIDADQKTSSPDLTHIRQVVAGETLASKTYDIYDDTKHSVSIAEFNQLDSLRDIPLGKTLAFPPLER